MSMEELYQDKVWTSREGVTLRLKEMAPSHRANLLRWIERNAGKLRRAELNSMYQFSMFVNGEMALDAIDSEISYLERISPEQYLDGLPLVAKLRRKVAKDICRPAVERARLDAEGKALFEARKREATLAGFDDPGDEPVVPHRAARAPLPRRKPVSAGVLPPSDRPREAPSDADSWGRMPGGHDTIDGWPNGGFALNGDGWG